MLPETVALHQEAGIPVWEEDDDGLIGNYIPCGKLFETSLFDPLDEALRRRLLTAYVRGELYCEWDIEIELMKLLALRGTLVSDMLEPRVQDRTLYSGHPNSLGLLSYLAVSPDGEAYVIDLLDQILKDSRDGLFFACMFLNTDSVNQRLMEKFTEWADDDMYDINGTDELQWLGYFIHRWLERYCISDRLVEKNIRIYFDNVVLE